MYNITCNYIIYYILYNSRSLQTHANPPASASRVLGLQVYATMPGFVHILSGRNVLHPRNLVPSALCRPLCPGTEPQCCSISIPRDSVSLSWSSLRLEQASTSTA